MKKIYMIPEVSVVNVEPHAYILDPSVQTVSGNAGLQYGGGGNEDARVKEKGSYNAWDDDWSK